MSNGFSSRWEVGYHGACLGYGEGWYLCREQRYRHAQFQFGTIALSVQPFVNSYRIWIVRQHTLEAAYCWVGSKASNSAEWIGNLNTYVCIIVCACTARVEWLLWMSVYVSQSVSSSVSETVNTKINEQFGWYSYELSGWPSIAIISYEQRLVRIYLTNDSCTKSCEKLCFALCPNYLTKPHLNFNIAYGRPKLNDVSTSIHTTHSYSTEHCMQAVCQVSALLGTSCW